MSILRAGVIGLGRMGSTFDDEIEHAVRRGGVVFLPYCHAPSYIKSARTHLVAGADPHSGQRQAFAQRWELETSHVYADYRHMLEAQKLDIVSVCTTARHRARIVMDCADAGVKAIWAEKPIALSLAEADAMIQVCRDRGVVLAINCARRWHPLFAEARKLIARGELGEILHVTGYGQCGLSHNGSHLIDTLRFLAAGNVTWVFGEIAADASMPVDGDLQGNGYLAFDNGVRGFLRGTPSGAAEWDFEVIGTAGRIRSSCHGLDFALYQVIAGGVRDRGLPVKAPYPWPTHMPGIGETIIEDLVHCMATGARPQCDGEDGRQALEVAMALHASHAQGGVRTDLPLPDRSRRIFSRDTQGDAEPARIRRQHRG